MLLGKLSARLIENLLPGQTVEAKIPGQRVIRAGEETIRPG